MDEFASVFPAPTREAWRALAQASLKGADFERRLVHRTRDGLRVEPLAEAADDAPEPRAARGPWRVAQGVDHPDPAAANELALADLAGGADALTLVLAGAPAARGYGLRAPDLAALDRALAGVLLPLIRLRLDAGIAGRGAAALLVALAERRGHALGELDLDLALDPVGTFAATGRLSAPWATVAARSAETLAALDARGFVGRAFLADGRPAHEAGASEAQELAFVLAAGVAHLRALEGGGHALDRARGAIGFLLVAESEIVLTLAKFRAMRRLWRRVEEACGLDARPIRLEAETAWRALTRRDPWVNLLRGTVAALGAGLGGADAITVLPFTRALGLPDGFARRLARNAQVILLEEANLWRVEDPGAGAGAVAARTEALCEAAWAAFQAIEREGGIVESLARGLFQARVSEVAAARTLDVATRREPITGTSEFPNLREAEVAVLPVAPGLDAPSPPPAGLVPFADLVAAASRGDASAPTSAAVGGGGGDAGGGVEAPALPPRRLAEPYEALRDRSDAEFAKRGRRPRVFLAPLGPVAGFTPRLTFARNAYEAGGVEAIVPDGAPFASLEALVEAYRALAAPLACLCGADETYDEALADDAAGSDGGTVATRAGRALAAAGAGLVALAGRPPADPARAARRAEAGIARHLFAGSDLLVLLAEAVERG